MMISLASIATGPAARATVFGRGLVLGLVVLLWLAGLAASAPAAAQWHTQIRRASDTGSWMTREAVEQAWPKLDDEQRLVVLDQLIGAGQASLALSLAQSFRAGRADRETARRYFEAVALRSVGRIQEAIHALRAILADHPDYIRVRMELAHALFVMQQDDSARHHFELLLGASGTEPGLEKTVRSFMATIDARRRWQFSTYVSLAPSSNLNQGASKREIKLQGLEFVLDETSMKRGGVGLVTGMQGGYRHPLTDWLDIVAAGGAHFKRYKETDFNDTMGSLSLGPRIHSQAGFVGVYALAEKRVLSDEPYHTSAGVMISAGLSVTATDAVFADVSCSRRNYDTAWRGTNLDYQSGHACDANLRYEHHFDSTTYLRLLGRVGRENTQLDHLDNRTVGAGAGIYRELPFGISLYMQAMHSWRRFGGPFPFIGEVRGDRRTDLSGHIVKRDLDILGFAPMLQYTYTINRSTIDFNAFDAHGASLTLTRKF